MHAKTSLAVGALAAALLLSAAGCRTHVAPADAAVPSAAQPARGITPQMARLGERTVAGSPAQEFTSTWYVPAGRPRLLVLLNRRFAGDEALWRSDWRFVELYEKYDGSPAAATAATAPAAGSVTPTAVVVTATPDPGRATATIEVRRLSTTDLLPESIAERFLRAFSDPYLAARCTLVDADVTSRLAQAEADKARHEATPTLTLNLAADAYAKHADWIIELIARPTGRSEQPLHVTAKVVDLKQRQVLVWAGTEEYHGAGSGGLAGEGLAGITHEQLDREAAWLAATVSRRLAERFQP